MAMAVTCKCSFFSHSLAPSSPKSTSLHRNLNKNISISPTVVSGIRVSSPCRSYNVSTNPNLGAGLKGLGVSDIVVKQMGFDRFRVSSVADSGMGGVGDGSGNSGDGNSGGRGGNGGGGGDGDDEGEGGESNWFKSLVSWYLAALEAYPVLTKAVTSALLTFIGDLACQVLIDKVSTLDMKRTFMFTFLGFALVGPTLHLWYLYLSKLVTVPGVSGTLLRLVLDQFLFSPIFVGVFLSSVMVLEGKPSQVLPKLQQEWFSAVVANWILWIPCQFFNFRFVPQQFQVLFANFVALLWNVFLSFKAHKEIAPKIGLE